MVKSMYEWPGIPFATRLSCTIKERTRRPQYFSKSFPESVAEAIV